MFTIFFRYFFCATFSFWFVVLAGCGGPTPASMASPDLSPLQGNWLVVGKMPSLSVPPSLGLAVTMDVVSGQLVASGHFTIPCNDDKSGFAAGGGGSLESTVNNKDGSFLLQDKLIGQQIAHSIVLHGMQSKAVGGPWSGTYVMQNPNPGCSAYSGDFTASSFEPISGTYVGTSKFSGSDQPLKVALTLQEGGTRIPSIPGASLTGTRAMTGTIQVEGSSCFTSGVSDENSGVYGNSLDIEFTMDDGSKVSFAGDTDDLESSTLITTHFIVIGGDCDKSNGFFQTAFVRQ